VSWALVGLSRPVAAGEPQSIEDVYSALRDFAGQRGTSLSRSAADNDPAPQDRLQHFAAVEPRIPNDAHHAVLRQSRAPAAGNDQSTEDVLSALRSYVGESTAHGATPANAAGIQLAEASKTAPAWTATSKSAPAKRAGSAADATYIGTETCLTCHATQAAAFNRTLMGRLKTGCETCHGPGSAHAAAGGGRGVGGIISFRADDKSRTAAENNAICLSCHDKGHRAMWQGSTHETRGVACTNCHSVMKNLTPKHQLAKANEIDVCFQCHKNKRAEIWRSSHMPVREGKMTCTSCHNPHGSFGDSLLKEATVNDNCYKCHAEKRGPFLWEHAPVRENCANCHDPHGSNNDFLLKISRPRLCQQCHNAAQHPSNPRNPVSVYAIGRECQNCHSTHHGSNSPAGARFQR
jgi:DmsE family decaheme c-type cytochrome